MSSPTWSPNGRRIAFADKDHHLFVMRSNGRHLRRLDLKGVLYDPAWSPDGKRIAFARMSKYKSIPESDIYVARLDGSKLRNLTPSRRGLSGLGSGPSWSPGGGRLAFSRGDEGCGVIFVMRADGSKKRRVTPDECGDRQHLSPVWSPAGGAIAYVSKADTGDCGDQDEIRIEQLRSGEDVTVRSVCSGSYNFNVSWQSL